MQTVRVFISSTFTDFSLERNILHNDVFPRIKKLCAYHNREFQAVDLRWGITERDSRDYSTLDICLEEVRQCQRVTPRPNFIFLSGSKYGWRPLPRRIPRYLFWNLLNRLRDPGQARLLKEAYRQDQNDPDAGYVFTGLPAGGSEAELRGLLRKAADACGRDGEGLFTSATHLELLERLALPDFKGSAICAVRTLKNVPEGQKALYYDTLADRSVDEESLAEAVRAGREAEKHCPDTWHYTLDLSDPGEALKAFADFVYEKMEKHILAELDRESSPEKSDETEYHRKAMEEHARLFRGRKSALEGAEAFIRAGRGNLLVVRGPAGCGKTAFTAKLAALTEQGGRRVFYRCVGLTGNSADIRKVTEELKREMPEGRDRSASGPVIFLDGADRARNPRAFLRAAARMAEEYSCVVLSMPDEPVPGTEGILPGDAASVRLEALTKAETEEILSAYLEENRRRLTPAQKECLAGAYALTRNMHIFRALMRQALKWRSFDPVPSPAEAVRRLEESTARGSAHLPPTLARRLRLYLAASREGLSGAELQGALSRDREVLEEFLRLSEHLLPGTEDTVRKQAARAGPV